LSPHLALALSIALGCAPSVPESGKTSTGLTDSAEADLPGTEDLTLPEDWAALPEASDPFPDHRPESVDCDEAGWHEEDGVLEVETNLCNYASLVQLSQADVLPGDGIELLVYHSALSSVDEPAEAHFAVLLDGTVLWEETIPIPSASEIYTPDLQATAAVVQGTPIVVHLHNHGGNAWKLGHLRRVRP